MFLDAQRSILDVCCESEWGDDVRKKFPISDYQNFRQHYNQEYTLSKDSWRPGCQSCRLDEESYGDSGRGLYRQVQTNIDNKYPQDVTIHTGNPCNLKCLQCSAENSSNWNSFILNNPQLTAHDPDGFRVQKNGSLPEDQLTEFIDDSVLSENLKVLRLTGGEPLYNKISTRIIKNILHTGHYKNIEIVALTTNGTTVFNDVWKEFLKKIPGRLILSFSSDGCGDVFEYIRRNHSWDRFCEVVEDMRTTVDHLKLDADLSVAYCLQALNAKTYKADKEFYENWKPLTRGYAFATTAIGHPSHMTLHSVPNSFKENWLGQSEVKTWPYSKMYHKKMIQYLDLIDQADKHKSFRNFVPELGEIYYGN
jgi:organic radical activating enzyme